MTYGVIDQWLFTLKVLDWINCTNIMLVKQHVFIVQMDYPNQSNPSGLQKYLLAQPCLCYKINTGTYKWFKGFQTLQDDVTVVQRLHAFM